MTRLSQPIEAVSIAVMTCTGCGTAVPEGVSHCRSCQPQTKDPAVPADKPAFQLHRAPPPEPEGFMSGVGVLEVFAIGLVLLAVLISMAGLTSKAQQPTETVSAWRVTQVLLVVAGLGLLAVKQSRQGPAAPASAPRRASGSQRATGPARGEPAAGIRTAKALQTGGAVLVILGVVLAATRIQLGTVTTAPDGALLFDTTERLWRGARGLMPFVGLALGVGGWMWERRLAASLSR